MRVFAVIFVLVILCGCRSVGPSGVGLRADDRRFSLREREVILAARNYLEQRFQKPLDGYYTIKKTSDGYGVIVSIPTSYEHGRPGFAPESSRIVELGKDLTVKRCLPEY
jgi:hypothetical protein